MSAWLRRTPHFRRKNPYGVSASGSMPWPDLSYSVADQLHSSVCIVHFGSRHDFMVGQAVFLLDCNTFWRPCLDYLIEVLLFVSTVASPETICPPHCRSRVLIRAHSFLLSCTSCLSASPSPWLQTLSASSPSRALFSSVEDRLHFV